MKVLKTVFFSSVEIDIDNLTYAKNPDRELVDKLKKDIEQNGLLNPLEIVWWWNNGSLGVHHGNHRIFALKELGYKKVPCNLRVYVFEGQEKIVEGLKKILPYVSEQIGETNGTPFVYKDWR